VDTQVLRRMMTSFDVFDNALLSHAYTDYMRDYELLVEVHVGPAETGTYSYLFQYCVEAHVRTSVPAEIYRASLDERLIEYGTGKDLDGFVWGVNWSVLDPGWRLVESSERAARWSQEVGLDFHEVHINSNAYAIVLVFADLTITRRSDELNPGINRSYIPLA
jgi:hypothetical protein